MVRLFDLLFIYPGRRDPRFVGPDPAKKTDPLFHPVLPSP